MRLDSRLCCLTIFAALLGLTLPAGACLADEAAPAKADKPKATLEKRAGEKTTAENSAEAKEEKPAKREPKKVRLAVLDLGGDYAESPGVSGPFAELDTNLAKLVSRIDRARKDTSIAGLILRFDGLSLGPGKRNELRQAIYKFRKGDKKVIAQIESADMPTYLVACACDEVVLPESGDLMLVGIRAEPMFYKQMLEHIGVEADFIHIGEAKGAAEPYTRKRWSEPVKQNITALLDDIYQQAIETIALDRPMTEAQASAAIDEGLITARRAKELGLVDRVAYPHELRSLLTDRYGADTLAYVENYGRKAVDTDFSGPTGLFKLMKLLAGGDADKKKVSSKKVAVVYAVGAIMTGKSVEDPFSGESTLGSTTIVEALDKAARAKDVAAIVLRIDSPGGSALASDLIWSKIRSIDKPVVASMGDVAASGGYYIAMGCDSIVAEPGAITGSIGVVGGKLALGGLYRKLGITTDLISRGENSGLMSANRPWNESERRVIQAMMEECYEQFTAKAAQGRGLEQDRIKELGGGRVYSGKQAQELGLVDSLGTLSDAIDRAKELAKIDSDTEVELELLPEPVDFFESLFGDSGAEKEVRVTLDLAPLPEPVQRSLRKLAPIQRLFQQRPVALVMPLELVIE